MSLNPEQRAAVEHRGGPLLVLAGAGTGKTRVITHRVGALLEQGVPPWRILAVTFTNRAAGEMRQRIAGLCDDRDDLRELWVGTFHSICARILRRHGEEIGLSTRFSIYDVDDQISTMGRVLKEMNVSERLFTARGVLGHIDRAKNQGLGPESVDELDLREPVASVVKQAYQTYANRLRAADAADFGDLLLLAVQLLGRPAPAAGSQLGGFDPIARLKTRFQYVVVDEFQDTNPIQAKLVDLLAGEAELCVVGDDDQAIYGWRGADVEQILGFPDRHPGTRIIRLEQNYRSTEHILECADAIIRRNHGRLGKTLWSDLGEGEPVRVLVVEDEREEARRISREIRRLVDEGASPEDFAIFYRTHAQSRALENEIRQIGLGLRIVGGVAFYARMEVKDLLAYLTVLVNPRSDAHLIRILNRPTRGIGKTSVDRLVAHAGGQGVSLWEALRNPAAAGLGKAATRRVGQFREMMHGLLEATETMRFDELASEVLERTGYRESLAAEETQESHTRLENLQELLGNMTEYADEHPGAALTEFLELVSLVTSDDVTSDAGSVTLMTVHSAKGLEFERVYMTGMEERVFPHARVLEDPIQMEEERRLAYVAVTRAKRYLSLSVARRRRLYGQLQVGTPSRFVGDLPDGATTRHGGAVRRPPKETATKPRESRWDDDIEYEAGYSSIHGDPDLDAADVLGDVDGGSPLYIGMTVRHGKFGQGEVLGWSGMGRDLKLQLRFPEVGTKTILARFCNPV